MNPKRSLPKIQYIFDQFSTISLYEVDQSKSFMLAIGLTHKLNKTLQNILPSLGLKIRPYLT